MLPHVEFVYNNMVNQSIGKAPFDIVYTYSPHHVFNLVVLPIVAGGSKAVGNVVNRVSKSSLRSH